MKNALDPAEVNRLLQEAEAAYRARRYAEAERLYNGILAFEKHIPVETRDEEVQRFRASLTRVLGQVYNNLGLIRGREGKTGQALECFRTALDYAPGSVEALTNAARFSSAQGNFDKALAYATDAIRIDPQFTPAIVQFGQAALETGRTAEARAHFEKAAAKGERLPGFLMTYGRVLEAEENPALAKEKYIAAASHPVAKIHARLLAGAVCQRHAQFEEAREHFLTVLAVEPRNLIANSAFGLLEIHLGQYDQAEKALQTALAVDPAHLDTIGNYALLLYLTARFEQALTIAGELAKAPKANEAQRRAGTLVEAGSLRRLGRPEEALDALHRLTLTSAKAVQDWAFHKEKGLNLEALGKFSEAFQAFTEGNRLFHEAIDRSVLPGRDATADVNAALAADYGFLSQSREGPGEAPVFLLGFQQSGHQVLGALLRAVPELSLNASSGVFPALRLQLEKRGGNYPALLGALGEKEVEDLRGHYRQSLKHAGSEPGKILLHANPANLYELPLILRMFPTARVIYVGAHPLDGCLHCYFKDFVPGRATRVYGDLGAIAGSLADSLRLWEKFKAEMRFAHIEVRVEDLFDKTEDEINRVLAFLREGAPYPFQTRAENIDGLNASAFDQKTLSPPGRWKNYREHIAPVIEALGAECQRRGYEAP